MMTAAHNLDEPLLRELAEEGDIEAISELRARFPEPLEVRENSDGYHVVDPQGGVWWPSEDTQAQIARAADPEAEALLICEDEPMRGEWRS